MMVVNDRPKEVRKANCSEKNFKKIKEFSYVL